MPATYSLKINVFFSGANLRFWYLMSTLYHFDIEIIDAPKTLEWKSNLLAKELNFNLS